MISDSVSIFSDSQLSIIYTRVKFKTAYSNGKPEYTNPDMLPQSIEKQHLSYKVAISRILSIAPGG